jgi:hypothetical protein
MERTTGDTKLSQFRYTEQETEEEDQVQRLQRKLECQLSFHRKACMVQHTLATSYNHFRAVKLTASNSPNPSLNR